MMARITIFISILANIFSGCLISVTGDIRLQDSEKIDKKVIQREEVTSRLVLNPTSFAGQEIKIAIANFPPFLDLSESSAGLIGSGQAWELLKSLSLHFNFTPVLSRASDDVIAYRNESMHKWEGIIELLMDNISEITTLPMAMTEVRQTLIDFSAPIGTATYGILVKRPQSSSNADALLKPFSVPVWILVVLFLVLTGPIIFAFAKIRSKICDLNEEDKEKHLPFDECIWFSYASMLKQNADLNPIANSTRILLATWWLFTLLLSAFYTGNLTAYLTFSSINLPINSIDDLKAFPDIKFLMAKDSALLESIKTHPNLELLGSMLESGKGKFVKSRREALELVRSGGYVYINQKAILNYIIIEDNKRQRKEKGEDRCDFYTAPLLNSAEGELYFWYGFGFRKGSLYRKLFNEFYQRLNYFGILNHLYYNSTSSSKICEIPKGFVDNSMDPMENRSFFTTYIMVAIGLLLGLITLLFEIGYFRYRKGSQKDSSFKRKFSPLSFLKSNSSTRSTFSISPLLPPYRTRPKTPFYLRYPEFSSGIKAGTPEAVVESTRKLSPEVLERTQRVIYSGESFGGSLTAKDKRRRTQTEEELRAFWDEKENKLFVKDIKRLRENITYEKGVPFVYVQFITDSGPQLQKMKLNNKRIRR